MGASARFAMGIALWLLKSSAIGQAPFELDPTFDTSIQSERIASALPLPDGKLLVAGTFDYPGSGYQLNLGRLNGNGMWDLTFSASAAGSAVLMAWDDRFYVLNTGVVRRVLYDGEPDPDFLEMNLGPYFGALQAGDYFVYPDGRILLSGDHLLSDSIRGFEGHYNLIWFSNEGYLDTTQVHRACDGFVEDIFPLPDGKFLLSGSWSVYDGTPVPNSTRLIRVFGDGSLDTTFAAPIWWGNPNNHTMLSDGKHLLGGAMQVYGIPNDTIGWVRLSPDGALDVSFNNSLPLLRSYSSDPSRSGVNGLMMLDSARYVITGAFDRVDGQVRGAIALVDSSGHLLDDYFTGNGCGMFDNNGIPAQNLAGITPGQDGNYYIFGSYHGYDDGTMNYTGQRMVSRLYGLDVGMAEQGIQQDHSGRLLWIHPNPASTNTTLYHRLPIGADRAYLVIRDMMGRQQDAFNLNAAEGQTLWDTRTVAPGTYSVELIMDGERLKCERVIVRP